MSLVKSIGNKKVNFDFNKDFISIFTDKIKSGDIQFINQTLKALHPSDVANLIENLSIEIRTKLIEMEEFDIDPETFIEINESIQTEVLQLLSSDSISKILKRLESDDAVSILENLAKVYYINKSYNKSEKLLNKLIDLKKDSEEIFNLKFNVLSLTAILIFTSVSPSSSNVFEISSRFSNELTSKDTLLIGLLNRSVKDPIF